MQLSSCHQSWVEDWVLKLGLRNYGSSQIVFRSQTLLLLKSSLSLLFTFSIFYLCNMIAKTFDILTMNFTKKYNLRCKHRGCDKFSVPWLCFLWKHFSLNTIRDKKVLMMFLRNKKWGKSPEKYKRFNWTKLKVFKSILLGKIYIFVIALS